MNQDICDAIWNLRNEIDVNLKRRNEEANAILPEPRYVNYRDSMAADLKGVWDRWYAENDRLVKRYSLLLENCDHCFPDGTSAISDVPCDASRCGFCGGEQ